MSLPTREATEFREWHLDLLDDGAKHSEPRSSSVNQVISEAERRYLRAVVEHPGQPSSAYPKLAGMSPKGAQEIRRGLVASGYLREHRVQTAGRGRSSIVLEPLEAAHRALQDTDGEGEVNQ